MKRYYLILLVVVAAMFTACNKNQNKTNNIDGYWEVTYMELSGSGGFDYPVIYFNFNSCKLRERGYCDMRVEDFWNGNYDGIYNVTHKGDQVNMTIDYGANDKQPYSFELVSLSDSRMVLENLDPEPGTYKRLELRKQE